MKNKNETIRCFCNDKYICPDFDYCDTSSVCLTKHVKYANEDQSEYKYFCGDYGPNSFRQDIIQYRDCYLKTNNKNDYDFVIKNSNEYCCDDYDFCNKELKPIQAFYDLNERLTTSHIFNNKNNKSDGNEIFTLSNIILLSFALLIIIIFLIIASSLYFINKRNKKLKKLIKDGKFKSEDCPFIDSESTNNDVIRKKILCFYIPGKYNMKKMVEKIDDKDSISNSTATTTREAPFIVGSNLANYIQSSSGGGGDDDGGEHTNGIIPGSSNDGCGGGGTVSTTISTGTGTGSSSSQCISSSCNADQTFTFSGSGKLGPVVVNRTIARDIKRIECIGKGRYGAVWKARWADDLVAVKVFSSNELKSWENEINIYLTQCLRDDNILGFIAADLIDQEFYSELWIITDYHENGALYDYLNLKTITPLQLIKMALSITKGLFHLHRAYIGCKGKVPLAHCDLKTKNILIKGDLTCCIGDLGLALCGDNDGNIQPSTDIRIGTKRYMAPEILNRSIDTTSIYAYQKADIYSLSLIFWELLRRCEYVDPITHATVKFDFQLPYFEHADMNPDENQMRTIVCEKKLRPEILSIWENSEFDVIRGFTDLIRELWHEVPDGRLKVFNVKRSLEALKSQLEFSNAFNVAPLNDQIV